MSLLRCIDVAVLKVDVDHPLPALKWADSDALQIGDPVLTIGNPLGLGMSVSAGIVSALNRNLHDTPFDSYIQTDAAINHGNSGGPLIDRNGSVVGLDTALYNPEASGGFIGIGFAIPSNIVSFVVQFLLNPNHPKPGWIGVTSQDINDRLAEALGVPRAAGAIVSAVDPSGPAVQAGLRPADVLETIDGVQQSDSRAFMRSIVRIPVGTSVHLYGLARPQAAGHHCHRRGMAQLYASRGRHAGSGSSEDDRGGTRSRHEACAHHRRGSQTIWTRS